MSVASNLMRLSDDQLQTQYQVVFPEGIPGGGDSDMITLRMDTTFTPPEMTVGSYELFKNGVKIVKTNMLQEMDKAGLQFEVRLDQQWKVFDAIQGWFKKCYDYNTGTALLEAATRTSLYVQALDTQGKVVKTMKFLGVKLKTLAYSNGFDNQGADPVRLQLTFIFNDFDYE